MFIQIDMNGFLEMYTEMQTKNTKSFESIFLKQSNPAFSITRNLQFIWQFTMLSFLKLISDDTSLECSFETRQCFLENTSEGDDFDWALNSVSTIISLGPLTKLIWRFLFMSSSKNLFVNFYLDFDKIENVGWKTSVDNLHEFYRIWCNIFF